LPIRPVAMNMEQRAPRSSNIGIASRAVCTRPSSKLIDALCSPAASVCIARHSSPTPSSSYRCAWMVSTCSPNSSLLRNRPCGSAPVPTRPTPW